MLGYRIKIPWWIEEYGAFFLWGLLVGIAEKVVEYVEQFILYLFWKREQKKKRRKRGKVSKR